MRDAIDIDVNGRSLSHQLEAAPLGVDEVRDLNLARAWVEPGHGVPILNCGCGDIDCGAFTVTVTAESGTVTWEGSSLDRALRFDRADLVASLDAALGD